MQVFLILYPIKNPFQRIVEVKMRARFAASLAIAASALIGMSAEAKTLRWASPTDITTLDPYAHTESFTTSMLHHVFDPLVRRGRGLELEPALAVSWKTVKPDTWRFELRRDVKFHNGNPFTADDVVA